MPQGQCSVNQQFAHIAYEVNNFMNTSIEGATPNGIARAVRDGSAGLPPPKSGCPEEDAILCASAICTMHCYFYNAIN